MARELFVRIIGGMFCFLNIGIFFSAYRCVYEVLNECINNLRGPQRRKYVNYLLIIVFILDLDNKTIFYNVIEL